jgi:large subunit ribosomal protein L15
MVEVPLFTKLGELKAKLALEVWGASKSAVSAIEKAGGSIKILAPVAAE